MAIIISLGFTTILLNAQIFGSTKSASSSSRSAGVLDSCPGKSTFFSDEETPEEWIARYQDTVQEVLKNHYVALLPAANNCKLLGENDPFPPFSKASDALKRTASALVPWQDAVALSTLKESDMGSVLLELLRVYECTLQRYANNLIPAVEKRIFGIKNASSAAGGSVSSGPAKSVSSAQGGAASSQPADIQTFTLLLDSEQRKIAAELRTARPTLHRILRSMMAQDRVVVLTTPFDCLERASIDIRNELGLAATTASCLPRVWNARGSLRTSE